MWKVPVVPIANIFGSSRSFLSRLCLPALLLLVSTACAVPPSKPVTHGSPPPKEGDKDNDREQQAWIESMHRAAPGVDWHQIEKENRKRNAALLAEAAAADTANALGVGGVWLQRGATSQTGRTWVTTVASDGETVLVGSGDGNGGGLFAGTPGASSWAQRGNPIGTGVQELVVVPGTPEAWVAVVSGSSGLAVSTDQGESWQTPSGLPSPPCGFNIARLLREPGASRRVYLLVAVPWCVPTPTYTLLRSDDAGLHFSTLLSGSFAATPDMWMDRVHAGPLYLFTDTGLRSSADHGASFTLLSNFPGGVADTLRLAGSEAGAPSIYGLVTNSGQTVLFASTDGGRTWKNQGVVPEFNVPNGSVTASISNPNVLLLGGVNTYRSTDGGATFNLLNEWYQYYGDPVHNLHADLRGLDFVFYQGTETLFADTDGGTYMSTDLGASFLNATQFGMQNGEYYSTFTSKNDPNLVAGGTQDQGFQQSTPEPLGGMSFTQVISGDEGHLTSTAGDHNRLYSAYPGTLLVLDHETAPHGVTGFDFPVARNRSWMPFILADPTNANAVYLTGDPLFRLFQDGAGWHSTAMSQNFSGGNGDYLTALAISKVNQSYWYAASAGGRLWYSHNGGATWAESASQGPAAHYFYGTALLASTTTATTCFVGGSGYSGPAVYKTTDGGVTWQEMGEGLPSTIVLGLAFDDPARQNLYAAADAGAYVFDSVSTTWKSIVAGNAPISGYWSVEGVPALPAVRFGTYGKGIWDYRAQSPGQKFYTLAPCRVIDTRLASGRLAGPALKPSANRLFAMAGACGLPSTARAVSVNVTVAGSSAAGYLTLGASDKALPFASTVNYTVGAVRSNNAIFEVSNDGAEAFVVYNGSPGPVHFILDVNGYFE
jgi:hypothetical protein